MPTYDYECTGCGHRFELRRSFSDTDTVSCPRCGCHAQRIFSSVPIIFKGSGFYVTDHRGPDYSSSPNPAATPPNPTGEVKAEPKAK